MRRPAKKFLILSAACFFLALKAAFSAEELPNNTPRGLTLSEAYRLALKRSEDIAIKAEVIHEAEGRFYRALNVILPRVDFVMTRFEQDAPKEAVSAGEGASGNLLRRTRPEKKFVFSQPLFSGFKEFAAIQGAGAEKAQRRYEKQRAEELLFVDVMESFYAVMESREDARISGTTQKILEERVKELEERAKLGRSRESEVQTAIADLKIVEYELAIAKRVEIIARQLLEFYIGREIQGELIDDSRDRAVLDIFDYLAQSHERADVKALEEAKTLAEKKVVMAQSGFFPSAKLEGNYYTERVGFQSGIDWDILLTVNVPIFDGAETIGNVKEAAAQREEARLYWEKTKRLTELDIRNAYEEFKSSRLEEKALLEASEAAQKSYEMQAEEYRYNLVNNLDVLDALRRHQDIQRKFNEARFEAKKSFWRLKVAAGETLAVSGAEL